MKNSIKLSTLIFGLFAITMTAQAQTLGVKSPNGLILSAGVESGISTGNFKDNHKWNFGGSLQADLPVCEQLYATFNAGYTNFYGKNNKPDLQLLPVLVGIKYFPVSIFYLQANAGTGFVLNKSEVKYQKTAAFLYAPQIGVQIPVGSSNFIDAGIRYEGTTKYTSSIADSKVNLFALRVAYAFSTK